MNNRDASSRIDTKPAAQAIERRSKPRVQCSYPAQISGYSSGMMKYEACAVLANMSGNGMYLRLKRRLEVNATILAMVRMSTSSKKERTVPIITATCKVLRVEPKSDGTYGVAVQIEDRHFP